jgi:DNA polymerase-3 subunit gamma/tau
VPTGGEVFEDTLGFFATSALDLAHCLNCAEGPTDTPCGACPSCIALARDGSGSVEVVKIAAASHNGLDDRHGLRERALFASARNRYRPKIFILDEAHMVTLEGFNTLLKIVEEPPEHVKIIFATTEPGACRLSCAPAVDQGATPSCCSTS